MLDDSLPPEDHLPELPTDESSEAVSDIEDDAQSGVVIETELQTQEAAERLQEMESLDPQVWHSLDLGARLEALQNIEDTMAELQGRSSVPIEAEEMDSNVFGGYDGQGIRMNINHLQSDMPVEEIINTIIHEGRHAYQDFAVNTPGVVGDRSLTSAWADNQQAYYDPTMYGQEIYATQPIEEDAFRYANRITNALIAAGLGEMET
jgi:hypothetical protein